MPCISHCYKAILRDLKISLLKGGLQRHALEHVVAAHIQAGAQVVHVAGHARGQTGARDPRHHGYRAHNQHANGRHHGAQAAQPPVLRTAVGEDVPQLPGVSGEQKA